jgi:hypothetical protein
MMTTVFRIWAVSPHPHRRRKNPTIRILSGFVAFVPFGIIIFVDDKDKNRTTLEWAVNDAGINTDMP